METRLVERLQRLNKQSVDRAFTVEALDWTKPIDKSLKWTPDEMITISYLPSYDLLTNAQKLRFNQLIGLSICEQFIWFENVLLNPALRSCKRIYKLNPEMNEAIDHFMEEEDKHGEIFLRMLMKAEPENYSKENPLRIFKLSKTQNFIMKIVTKFPQIFLWWIWIALFFEERTLDISKKYNKALKEKDVDWNFWQCHYYHMLDEVRHQQIDECFLATFYNKANPILRKINAKVFINFISSYFGPKRMATRILELMQEEFDDLSTETINTLKDEFDTLRTNVEFQRSAFSRQGLGRTYELLAQYDEMDDFWDLLIEESKEDHLGKNRFVRGTHSTILN